MKVIANYLPQFHITESNNKWWGEGFTEWTTLAGHERYHKDQERIVPGELGFYDLSDVRIQEKQCELAEQYGIDAFMYWMYYFGDNQGFLLDKPIKNRLLCESKLPFCLSWANHDWRRKEWDRDANVIASEILIEQRYVSEDIVNLYKDLIPYFSDDRYFRYNGRLVFGIFKPLEVPFLEDFIEQWQAFAKRDNLGEFIFIGHSVDRREIDGIVNRGVDLVNHSPLNDIFNISYSKLDILKRYLRGYLGFKNFIPYKLAKIKVSSDKINQDERVVPTIIPRWDHTPRSGKHGTALLNPNVKDFGDWCRNIFKSVVAKSQQLVILKSWNEWGEGNFIEPDLKNKRGYLETLKSEKVRFRE